MDRENSMLRASKCYSIITFSENIEENDIVFYDEEPCLGDDDLVGCFTPLQKGEKLKP